VTPTATDGWRARALHAAAAHWAEPLHRQSYYLLASTGVSAATGLLFWILAARRTEPAVLGLAAGMIAALGFLSYLTSFALPYAMLRYGGSTRPVDGLVNSAVAVSAVTSLLAAAVFAVIAGATGTVLAPLLRDPLDVLLFGFAGVGAGTGLLLDNLLAARQRADLALLRNTAAGLLKLTLLIPVGAGDPRGVYLALTGPGLITAVIGYALLPRVIPGYRQWDFTRTPLLRDAARFALHTFAGSLLSGAPQFAVPLIAAVVLGPYGNAFFYVAWSIAQVVYLVPTVISNITLSRGDSTPTGTLIRRSRRFSLLLVGPFVLAVTALAGPALHLYGTEYADRAAAPLRLLGLAALPWAIVIIAQTQLRIEHRHRALTVLTGFLCAASLAVPVVLSMWFGALGMAGGWLLSLAVVAGLAWWLTGHSDPTARPMTQDEQHMSPDADRKPPGATGGATSAARWPPDGRARIVALTCVALACSALVATGREPARAIGGALLACYLPGRLALGGLRRPGTRPDPALDHTLAVALSLVTTMLLGAFAAGFGLGFTGSRMALLSGALSAVLGLIALRRTDLDSGGLGRTPTATATTDSTGVSRWLSPSVALAAVPALALSAVLAVQVAAYTRHRPADSYYTELSVVAVGGLTTVRVDSRERSAESFRCEQRLHGVLVRQDRFALRPGRSILLPVTQGGPGRVEILLFRGTDANTYRRLIL
jgi:O-antigen/teichoic acid export membrane protein